MSHTSAADRYSSLQIALHWTVALLITAAWFTGEGMGRILRQKIEGGAPTWPIHVWLGLAVLAVVAIRIAVRTFSGVPGPVPGTGETEAKLRHWGHLVLYVLMAAVPIGGATAWFLGLDSVAEIHSLGGDALFYLAGGHALVALGHHYLRKDGTLRRMIQPG